MRPETLTKARALRARIANQAAIARHIGEYAAIAMYLRGRSILAQRTAAAVIQARVLRSLV